MTPTQQRQLALFTAAVDRHEKAAADKSWIGGTDPARHADIVDEYHKSYASLLDLFARALTNEEGHSGAKVGDGTPDAALAIGEDAFKAGFEAGVFGPFGGQMARALLPSAAEAAWSSYDPTEHIKELS